MVSLGTGSERYDLAFGLCDLGLSFTELGSVSLSELGPLRGPNGLTIERYLYLQATIKGEHYYSSFPYTSYAGMTAQGIADLKSYLDTVDPTPSHRARMKLVGLSPIAASSAFGGNLFQRSSVRAADGQIHLEPRCVLG